MQRSLHYFHQEANAKSRNEFIALMKRLCNRIRCAITCLLRASRTPETPASDEEHSSVSSTTEVPTKSVFIDDILEQHIRFRRWYIIFLLNDLQPTASYQSHIISLKVLFSLLQGDFDSRVNPSKSQLEYIEILGEFTPRGVFSRSLLDLILDPFDDVRQMASSVLRLFISLTSVPLARGDDKISKEDQQAHEQECYCKANDAIHQAISRAESKAQKTGRADHADGVGRLYDLLYASSELISKPKLWHQSTVAILHRLVTIVGKESFEARRNLPNAIVSSSLHAHLIALRYQAAPKFCRTGLAK